MFFTDKEHFFQAEGCDYFRVLHGRMCEKLTIPQISQALDIKKTDVENYYKAARKRLAAKLKELVHEHVQRYCDRCHPDPEFESEWNRIGQYLEEHGGLEQAVAKVYETSGPVQAARRQPQVITTTLRRLTQAIPKVPNRPDA
jgi:hypothetical protein